MQTMLELEELGFSSLEEYLRSPQLKSEGGFGTELECDGAGGVHLSLSRAKAALEYHYLLLSPARGKGETLLLRGTLDESGVRFDLNELGAALFQHCDEWVCRVAMGDSREFLVSRLRQHGDPASQPPAAPAPAPVPAPIQKPVEKPRSGGFGRLKGLFGGKKAPEPAAPTPQQTAPAAPAAPAFHLWPDSKRLFDTGLSAPVDGVLQRLVFKANAERRTLSLVRQPEALLRPQLDGMVLHRCKAGTEKRPFQFSIVMAVYNVAPYLEEAVESVLSQDIGFQKNVQLILVDDGSTDGSGLLCNRFAQRYPKNVVALHQANAGVASARNAGLAAAKGAYVNFMDPDDKLSPNALSAVSRFFSAHADEVDVVSIPLCYFEARQDSHWQNYKFDRGTRVINLWREWTVSAMNTAASFIRREAVQGLEFDSALPSGEDAKLLLSVVLEKMQLGVVSEATYWYRARSTGGSLMNTTKTKRGWYTEYFSHFHDALLERSRKRWGFVPEYVQNTLMMDLQWRLKRPERPDGLLSDQEWSAYLKNLTEALRPISDHVILAQRALSTPEMVQLLALRHGREPVLRGSDLDLHVLLEGALLCSCSELPVYFDQVRLENGTLTLEGYSQLPGLFQPKKVEQYLYEGGNYHVCAPLARHNAAVENSFGVVSREYSFRVSLPLGPQCWGRPLRLVTVADGQPIFRSSYRHDPSSPFCALVQGQYLLDGDTVLHASKSALLPERTTEERAFWERDYRAALEGKVLSPEQAASRPLRPRDLTRERYQRVLALRDMALAGRRTRPLWLLSDALDRAGGPCETLFQALAQREDCPAELCFVLTADSPDFARLSALGTVLAYGSEEHLRAHMCADRLLFSQERESVFSPFTGTPEGYGLHRYLSDLLSRQRYVLLRGGQASQGEPTWEEKLARKYPREELVLSGEADVPRVLEALIKN